MDAEQVKIYVTVLIISFVVGALIIAFVASISKQQKRNIELHKKALLAEITALEKERSRIASDLHDEFGPMLSAIKMKVNTFELSVPDEKEVLESTNKNIDAMLKRVREVSFDLMPQTLLRQGLITAISEFINYIGRNNQLAIKFVFDDDIKVNEQQSIHLYRIVQELIQNTIKHAEATEIKISIKKNEKNLVLTAIDNGKGFNYQKVKDVSLGLGLNNLYNRTNMLKGSMYLDSKEGKGTSYSFEIPL